jgi:hypothetical protein
VRPVPELSEGEGVAAQTFMGIVEILERALECLAMILLRHNHWPGDISA